MKSQKDYVFLNHKVVQIRITHLFAFGALAFFYMSFEGVRQRDICRLIRDVDIKFASCPILNPKFDV